MWRLWSWDIPPPYLRFNSIPRILNWIVGLIDLESQSNLLHLWNVHSCKIRHTHIHVDQVWSILPDSHAKSKRDLIHKKKWYGSRLMVILCVTRHNLAAFRQLYSQTLQLVNCGNFLSHGKTNFIHKKIPCWRILMDLNEILNS